MTRRHSRVLTPPRPHLLPLLLVSALSWFSTDLRKAPSLAGKMGELYTSLLQARYAARNSARDSARNRLTPRPLPLRRSQRT